MGLGSPPCSLKTSKDSRPLPAPQLAPRMAQRKFSEITCSRSFDGPRGHARLFSLAHAALPSSPCLQDSQALARRLPRAQVRVPGFLIGERKAIRPASCLLCK